MGFFSRLKQGLERTRINLAGLFSGAVIDEDFFEELETSLIAADIGVESTNLILERLRDTVKLRGLKTPEEVRLALRDEIKRILLPAIIITKGLVRFTSSGFCQVACRRQ